MGNVEGVSPIPGLVIGGNQSVMCTVLTRSQARKEKENPKPLPIKDIDSSLTMHELRELQIADPSLTRYRDSSVSHSSQQSGSAAYSFACQNGVLVRLFQKSGEEYNQIVVPQSLRLTVLSTAHDGLLAGHCGVKKTLARILNRFWWPGVSRDVRHHCQTCDVCQKVCPKGRVPNVPLAQMPRIEQPFQRVAVDIIGPFSPPSEDKHRYILTIIDVATRYPEAIPLKKIDSVSVAEALFSVFSRLGCPVELLSDNGSQFTSDMFTQFLRLLSIKGVHSSPYHAQSNGVVERFHGTLKPMLKKAIQNHPKLWHRFLPALLFACRELPNVSTGFSPFELLFGRKPRGPIDFLADSWVESDSVSESRSVSEHVVELRNTIRDMAELAHNSVDQARITQKFYHDKKCKERSFTVGDEVLVLLPTSANKLLMSWKGPFRVLECLDFDYLIDIDGKQKIYHPNMLKKYHRRQSHAAVPAVFLDEGQSVSFADILSPDFLHQSESVDKFSQMKPVAETLPGVQNTFIASVAVVSERDDSFSEEEVTGPVLQTLSMGETWKDVVIDENLTALQHKQIQELFEEYWMILISDPGLFMGVLHEIQLSTSVPVFRKQYPLPFSALATIEKEVKSMLALGVIEPSKSPFSAPVVLVSKPDGSTRFCCDYRMLNKVTISDAEPIPDHDSLFSQLSSAKFFTKIDLTKGYWQILVKEEDRPKTAFQTHLGLFQWIRMPFGLATAPATFARAMRALDLGSSAINFFDDILIHSESWDQHLLDVRRVLSKLKSAGFTARPTKIFAGFRELQFLGHVVGESFLRPAEGKVEKILKISVPTTKRQVRALLGLVSYYRRYIANFASITAPISDLLSGKASRQIHWTPSCQSALEKIQRLLSQDPVLLLPDCSRTFTVRTDASSIGIGGVLFQEFHDKLHPVSFISRKLLPRETRYSTIERECLAIVWVLTKFARYLWGQQFVLQTDHRPLTYLQSGRFHNSRILRWALSLQEFTFSVLPVSGNENVFADVLSRSAIQQIIP